MNNLIYKIQKLNNVEVIKTKTGFRLFHLKKSRNENTKSTCCLFDSW